MNSYERWSENIFTLYATAVRSEYNIGSTKCIAEFLCWWIIY